MHDELHNHHERYAKQSEWINIITACCVAAKPSCTTVLKEIIFQVQHSSKECLGVFVFSAKIKPCKLSVYRVDIFYINFTSILQIFFEADAGIIYFFGGFFAYISVMPWLIDYACDILF